MRFFRDIKKYNKYMSYSIRAKLKNEVAGAHLGWVWWLLEPVLFMFVYVFIAQVVFTSRGEYFPLMVFSGLTFWTFFNKTLTASVKVVRDNKGIVSKVYLPKFILILILMGVNSFKMSVSFVLIIVMMLYFQVSVTPYGFLIIPLFILLFFVTYGFSCLFMHIGVFVEDLGNILPIILRLVFYMSGIFFVISDRVPSPYDLLLLKVNPLALMIDSFRQALFFSNEYDYLALGIWLVSSIIISIIATKIVYKYENTYIKVIR